MPGKGVACEHVTTSVAGAGIFTVPALVSPGAVARQW